MKLWRCAAINILFLIILLNFSIYLFRFFLHFEAKINIKSPITRWYMLSHNMLSTAAFKLN